MRISTLAAAYAAGGTSPHEVVDEVLRRIEERGDDGVWISTFDRATLHRRCDALCRERIGGAPHLPLYGVPFGVKDNIDVVGLPTTAACPAFAYSPARHAGSVARLVAAGAIPIGKTNLDQFATGLNGTRSPYGAPESVFGGDLISGGSSSGSAVAVAAGTVPFTLGTDTAGSGRVPAAMNGIVGLKPTRGLVGASGVVPACRSLDCVTVFAQDVDDAAAVLDVLAGPDPDDPWSRPARPYVPDPYAPDPYVSIPYAPIWSGDGAQPAPRVAVAVELDHEGDAAFADVFAHAADRAVASVDAAHVTDMAPLREAGDLLYSGPWVAERLAGLAPFLATHGDDVLPVIRTVVEKGGAYDAVDAFRARHRLQELRAWCGRLWTEADVLLLPTTPTTFTRADLAADPVGRNLVLGRYTQFANLLDLAAVALPAGVTADGRPVGLTLLGPAFSERRLLDAARHLFG